MLGIHFVIKNAINDCVVLFQVLTNRTQRVAQLAAEKAEVRGGHPQERQSDVGDPPLGCRLLSRGPSLWHCDFIIESDTRVRVRLISAPTSRRFFLGNCTDGKVVLRVGLQARKWIDENVCLRPPIHIGVEDIPRGRLWHCVSRNSLSTMETHI